jgi:hypothetical protein
MCECPRSIKNIRRHLSDIGNQYHVVYHVVFVKYHVVFSGRDPASSLPNTTWYLRDPASSLPNIVGYHVVFVANTAWYCKYRPIPDNMKN